MKEQRRRRRDWEDGDIGWLNQERCFGGDADRRTPEKDWLLAQRAVLSRCSLLFSNDEFVRRPGTRWCPIDLYASSVLPWSLIPTGVTWPWLREGSNRGIAVLCLRGCQSIEIIGCARHGLCDSSKEASFDRTMFHDAQSLHCRSDSTDIVQ